MLLTSLLPSYYTLVIVMLVSKETLKNATAILIKKPKNNLKFQTFLVKSKSKLRKEYVSCKNF